MSLNSVSGVSGGLAETMHEFEQQEEAYLKARLKGERHRRQVLRDRKERQKRTRVRFIAGFENGKYFGEGM